jgi:hypothetical protein
MKKILSALFVIAFVFSFVSCTNKNDKKLNQVAVQNGVATLVFQKTEHDFGTVLEGEKVTYAFQFENKGTSDLNLLSVGTSCGCTASEYPRDPIKPGKSGKIQITFDSSRRIGMQHKQITIRSNTDPALTILNVYAQVIEKQ